MLNTLFPKLTLSILIPFTLAFLPLAHAASDAAQVAKFIGDTNFSRNVFDLTQKGGFAGAPVNQPWSGSYWALDHGSIAYPYGEHGTALGKLINFGLGFLKSLPSQEKHYEDRMTSIRSKIDHLDAQTIDRMAPSEKYDLFIGDHDFSLTADIWKADMAQLARIGSISPWEGSCHGWTAAASYSPRPGKATSLMSLDGKYLIPFYPDDLKALATLMWANSLVQDHTIMQGQRCQNKNPAFDEESGHVKDMTCQGVDPGDFHVTLLEMVGARKTPFIVDRSNNTQVWNQPIASYQFEYFNPASGEKSLDLKKAIVARAAFPNDPFAAYRSAGAVSIVGVHMSLKYVSETMPDQRKTDDNSNDNVKTLDMRYDLELDADSQIIGGEWRDSNEMIIDPRLRQNFPQQDPSIAKFPGFIWRFDPTDATIQQNGAADFMSREMGDFDLPGLDPTKMDFSAIVAASKKSAASTYIVQLFDKTGTNIGQRADMRPRPLSKVVNYLVSQSH